MLLTESFSIRGTSPAEPKPTSNESPDAILLTVKEARSFPTVQNAKRGANKSGVRGRTELHERVSTINANRNPK